MKNGVKFWNLFNIILVLLFVGFSIYVYVGFFYPDKSFYSYELFTVALRLFFWVFFPILIIVLIALYRAVYLGLLKFGSVIVLFLVVLFIGLIVYTLAEFQYSKGVQKRLSNFHPFLQLKPNLPDLKADASCTIFCLGGSTTEFKDKAGRGWPDLVEKEINKETGFENVRIYNCGKQWYSSQHILINYIENLKDLKPDVIIVMVNINDFLHNADFSTLSSGEFREDYGHFLGPLRNVVKYNGFTDLVFMSVKKLWYQKETEEIDTAIFPGLVSYERNLKVIIQLAKADGTLVILMTQPNIYKDKMSDEELKSLVMLNREAIGNGKQWSYNTAYTGLNLYNDKMRQIAQETGVEFIDLEQAIPKSLEYFYDDVHYRSKTFDVIAEYLSPRIQQILIQNNLP